MLTDRLYEAAFAPERWESALDAMAAASGSASGSLVVYRTLDEAPRFRATALTRDGLTAFVESGAWRHCGRMRAAASSPWRGFLYPCELTGASNAGPDAVLAALDSLGLAAQLNALVPLPTGETCGVTVERAKERGPHDPRERALLDALAPHLSRACLVAARMGLEAARSAAHAFALLGLPAAALRADRRVVAANDLFADRADLFAERGAGRLTLRDARADALFAEAVERAGRGGGGARSIPLRGVAGAPSAVLHVLPARRAARDILCGADVMVAATQVRLDRAAPEPPVLTALFDLTPSEARLCVEIARGAGLPEAARRLDVTLKTARTYLDRAFAKTGAHSQIDLLALLRSAAPPGVA